MEGWRALTLDVYKNKVLWTVCDTICTVHVQASHIALVSQVSLITRQQQPSIMNPMQSTPVTESLYSTPSSSAMSFTGIVWLCCSFSTTVVLVGAWIMSTGKILSSNEQEFADCDTTDSGCNGGYHEKHAFAFAKKLRSAQSGSYK